MNPYHWPAGDVSAKHLVLFEHSYQHCSHLLKIEGQTSRRCTQSSIHLEVKTQFRIYTKTQACTWTTSRSPLHVYILYVHGCIQKVFCVGAKKFFSWPFKMKLVGLVQTEIFSVWPKGYICTCFMCCGEQEQFITLTSVAKTIKIGQNLHVKMIWAELGIYQVMQVF